VSGLVAWGYLPVPGGAHSISSSAQVDFVRRDEGDNFFFPPRRDDHNRGGGRERERGLSPIRHDDPRQKGRSVAIAIAIVARGGNNHGSHGPDDYDDYYDYYDDGGRRRRLLVPSRVTSWPWRALLPSYDDDDHEHHVAIDGPADDSHEKD
jgi:hypothetical protein